MSILEGPVVFIDDEYEVEGTHAHDFFAELKAEGRPIAGYSELPPDSHMDQWDGLALVVVDWNLRAGEARQPGMSTLVGADRKAMISFLCKLLDRYFCLVVIISTEFSESIENILRDSGDFPDSAIGPRVKVVHKDDAEDGLIKNLVARVEAEPARAVLRTWEREYQRAKHRMFIDLSSYANDWPAYIVKAARIDGVEAGDEIVDTLYGNLRHRVDPVKFDLSDIDLSGIGDDAAAIQRVAYARRVLPGIRLQRSTIMPGDFFRSWRNSDADGSIWLNLTPACYTVRGRDGEADVNPRLHLLRGLPIEESGSGSSNASNKFRKARQESKSAIVDLLHEGCAYKFDFSSLQTFSWSTISKYRIGRLLPPWITQVQQRHAYFLTSEGVPRDLPEMYSSGGLANGGA